MESEGPYLPETQTPNTLTLTPNSQTVKLNEHAKSIWGRLLSTHIYLQPFDLHQSTFKLGRAPDCDVIIKENTFTKRRYENLSKHHFTITKEPGCPPYITDMSKNGTFINGKIIGKGNKNILQNNDEISVGFKSLKIYVFKTMQIEEKNDLPIELRSKYEPVKLLGIGACGEVKLVFEKSTCKPYAVKKILKAKNHSVNKINHVSKIQTEIAIMKSLTHPCVISLREIIETEEAIFIVLEYMEGGELSNFILSTNPLTENQTKYFFYQMILAVRYLHDKGITHRDLKPENVLLKSEKVDSLLKITDFGLSKIINDEDVIMKTICGTPSYLAPEILDGKFSSYNKQVDIWSLGVILYYMLCQELPFRSKDRDVLFKMILRGSYNFNQKIWKSISKEAKDLVEKMLTVDPGKRIKIDEIIRHPWISKDLNMKREVEWLIQKEYETAIIGEEYEMSYVASVKKRRLSNSEVEKSSLSDYYLVDSSLLLDN